MSEDDKLFLRLGIIGAIVGLVILNVIFLLSSIIPSEGGTIPDIEMKLGRAGAWIVESIVSAAFGFIVMYSTRVYYSERFSIAVATLIHACITFAIFLPVAYYFGWAGDTDRGFIMFAVFFALIYVLIWVSIQTSYVIQVKRINESLERKRSGKE